LAGEGSSLCAGVDEGVVCNIRGGGPWEGKAAAFAQAWTRVLYVM